MSKNKIKDRGGDPSLKSNSFDKSKYRDVQDAEFTEIKSDNKSKNDSK
jgi:hypothetical protein